MIKNKNDYIFIIINDIYMIYTYDYIYICMIK